MKILRHSLFLAFFHLLFLPFLGAETLYTTEGKYFEKITAIESKGGKKQVRLSNGRRVPLKSVVKIQYSTSRKNELFLGKELVISLINGDVVKGEVVKGGSLDLKVRVKKIGPLTFSLDYLKGLYNLDHLKVNKRQKYFRRTQEESPKKDVITLKEGGEIRGVVQSLGSDSVQFQVSGLGNKKIKMEKIASLQVAPLGGPFNFPSSLYVKVFLDEGEILSGEIVNYRRDVLTLRTFFGQKLKIPYSRLSEIYFFNGPFRYLSELKPHKVKVTPGMAALKGITYSPQFDQSALKNPLVIGGQLYRKGLGLHTKTKISYQIDKKYTHLYGRMGFAQSAKEKARNIIPKAVFRVYGDGKKLYDSGLFTAFDKPQFIDLSLKGVEKLVIEVDFAESMDDTLGRINFVDSFLVKK